MGQVQEVKGARLTVDAEFLGAVWGCDRLIAQLVGRSAVGVSAGVCLLLLLLLSACE